MAVSFHVCHMLLWRLEYCDSITLRQFYNINIIKIYDLQGSIFEMGKWIEDDTKRQLNFILSIEAGGTYTKDFLLHKTS